MRNANLFNQAIALIHEQQPELFSVEVLHQGVHVVVDAGGSAQFRTLLGGLQLAALAQFTCSKDGDGLCLAYAFILHEVMDGHLSQRIEVVAAVRQYLLHQFHCRHARVA